LHGGDRGAKDRIQPRFAAQTFKHSVTSVLPRR
jgi:hypothetical protein